jgi:3-hydroxyacyl-[acyl-carrier-protein] dehydratase
MKTEKQLTNLTLDKIYKYLRNRRPFLIIDFVDEVVPGKSARGYKNLFINEWYFKGHFPGKPMLPGVLQLEAMFNMSAMAIHTIKGNEDAMSYIARINTVYFKSHVLPGDRMDISTEILSYKRGVGVATGVIAVNKKIVCEANYVIVVKDHLPKVIVR